MNISIKKTSLVLLVSAISVLSFFTGCEEKGISEGDQEIQYYRKAQLSNMYTNEVLNLTTQFVAEVDALKQLTVLFKQETNDANLVRLQDQWKKIQSIWKQLELYDIGQVADSFVAFEINRWETDVAIIEGFIAGDEEINEAFVASNGSSSKGISAMEYFLFSTDNTVVLETFLVAENASRRMEYVVAVSENLHQRALDYKELWQEYSPVFIGALENGISGSQNQVINAMVTLIEEIIISKLGKPLGDTNGGIIEAARFEAYRSSYSKEIIAYHLMALKSCYTGDFEQTPFRIGFDDFLILIGRETLAASISEQLAICQDKLNAISGSIEQEIITNPEDVLAVKDAFRDLLVLIKVDLANVLGSTITFNDNDGD